MPDSERERVARLVTEARRLMWRLTQPAYDGRHWYDAKRRASNRFWRRAQNLRNLDALVQLDLDTPEDIMREAYP